MRMTTDISLVSLLFKVNKFETITNIPLFNRLSDDLTSDKNTDPSVEKEPDKSV